MAEISSSGDSAVTPASMPSAMRACGETGTDFDGARPDPAAGRDQRLVVVRPRGPGQRRTSAAARRSWPPDRGPGRRTRAGGRRRPPAWCARTAASPLPNTSPDMSPMPVTVKSSVSGFRPERREVDLHRLPGAAGGDAHLLVVVALGPARGERVAQPEAVAGGDLVGRVGEGRGALVRRHHQVRVVPVPADHVRRRDHLLALDVVGHVQHRGDERLVAGQHLGLVGLAVGRVGQPLAHEAALGPGRDDDRVLHLLRLDQPEHFGAEVLEPVRPAQPAARHPAEPQVHRLQPGRVDEDLELRPRLGQPRARCPGRA